MSGLIGSRRADGKIYYVDSSEVWAEFGTQPPGGKIAEGIWGGPNGTIWTHNGQYDGQTPSPSYLYFNGSIWSEVASPSIPIGDRPHCIFGSGDGQYVYSGGDNFVHRYYDGSWSEVATGFKARSVWCSSDGQHVWTASCDGNFLHLYRSTDYGITWSNQYATMKSDLGPVYAGIYLVTLGAVWGISKTEIYTALGFGGGSTIPDNPGGGGIVGLSGGTWGFVSERYGGGAVRYGNDPTLYIDGSVMIVGGIGAGTETRVYRDNPSSPGTLIAELYPGDHWLHDTDGGHNIASIGSKIFACFDGLSGGNIARCLVSSDGGDNWTTLANPFASSFEAINNLTPFSGNTSGQETIIGTRTTLYQVNAAKTAWEPFPVQPPGGSAVWGVWGGPGGTIWTHDGGPGGVGKYLFFDGESTWTEYNYPAAAGSLLPQTIVGSSDGSRVYAGIGYLGASGFVHRWTGSAWVECASGWRAGSIWCDSTGQHVWAAPGPGDKRAYLYHSDDYGATWADVFPDLISEAGGSSWTMHVGTVHGTAINDVYVGVQWEGGGPPEVSKGGRVYRWNGTSWSVFSTVPTHGPRGSLHFGSSAVIATGSDASSTKRVLKDYSGTMTPVVYSGHDDDIRGRGIEELSDGTLIVAMRGVFGQPASTYKSIDDGDTWVEISHPWGSAEENVGSISLANWSAGPVVQNQNPAPSSSGNRSDGSLYLEVVDSNGDLVSSSVRVWVDGVPAWQGSSALSGWSGSRSTVANGYGYTVTPDSPLRSGATISVRVYAVDATERVLDETYTFDTGVFLDALTSMVSERGGDLIRAEGLFPRGEALEVTLDAEPCYGGQGKGYSPVSDDGQTLEVASPPLVTVGASKTFEIVTGAGTLQGQIAVVERTWHRAEFETRTAHPPWVGLGPRRLDSEPPVGD